MHRSEVYAEEDREAMVATSTDLGKPVIHYKVLAAGRTEPRETLAYVAEHLRPGDAMCVGVFPKDKPGVLAEDLALFEASLG